MLLWVFRSIFVVIILGVLFVSASSRPISGADDDVNFWTVVLSGLGMAVFVFLLDILTPKKRLTALAGVFFGLLVGLLISGAGIGIGWPHLSAWAMSKVDDPAEGPAAAAAINTVQLISAAFGAALAGVVVNLADGGDAAAARWLFISFAVLAALAVVASTRSGKSPARRGSN